MLKSKIQNQIFGFIAAMRTMLDNYPELQRNDNLLNLLNSNSPIGFLLNLAEICGLSKTDLLNWLSKILSGSEVLTVTPGDTTSNVTTKISEASDNKVTQGILDSIEECVRIILLANVKNLFTCTLNPIITDEVLASPNKKDTDSKGITIPISTVDMFNVLQHSPNSSYGKNMYFDNEMPSNEFWKSLDFNVFLWYIINKGNNINDENLKNIWDNRIRHRKKINKNDIFKKNFFNIYNGNDTYINLNENEGVYSYKSNEKENKKDKKKSENYLLKKQYVIVEYNETHPIMNTPNTITIWLNSDRYKYKTTVDGKDYSLNKTVFEFNYDFIYSLKLFNSKTIVANVINSILGISNSVASSVINTKYSLEQEIIAGKVSEIIKEVMENENTVINDCFFSFSNDEYDNLLNQAELKYSNSYQFGDVNGKINNDDLVNITNEIASISNATTLNEEQSIINNLFTNVSSVIPAENGEITVTDKFTLGDNIIFDLIKESVTQIVLQVLSPKVMILYAVNSYFMGDVADGDFSKINVTNFINGLRNLIVTIVKQILELIVNELLLYLLTELKELLNELLKKLIKERIEYYIEIIRRLYALIDMFYNKIANTKTPDSFIDNVNYADIVPNQNKPQINNC